MLKNEKNLLDIYQEYKDEVEKLENNNSYFNDFYNSFLAGKTELSQTETVDTKIFDEEWIKTVESYFPSLNKIVMNPRSSVMREEAIVEIEKAKKVDSASIKHLAANTHMLREVTKEGEVIPKKILTSYAEIDYSLYENRFIMTLINRLFIFVRTRYETIKSNVESFEKRNVKLKSNFPLNETRVDIDLNITLTDESEDKEINEYNRKLLKRVEELDRLVTSLKTHQFMDLMKNAKRIYPPILKTNVITKNVDYHNAYLLWLFLDQYNTLTFKLNIEEKNLPFDEDYLSDIKQLVFHNVGTIINNHDRKRHNYNKLKPLVTDHESIKIITDNPADINYPIEDLVIEDNQVNEYYLEAYKKILSKSLDYHQDNSKTPETALKRALRETIEISNALYSGYFELEEETNIFKMLITEIDVDKEVRKVKHKMFIANMIREVKVVDFNNALRQERKLINELDQYYGLIKNKHEKDLARGKESLIDLKELEKAEQLNLKNREKVDLELEYVKKLKEQNEKLRKESLHAFNAYQTNLNHKLRDELKALENIKIKEIDIAVAELDQELSLVKRVNEEKLINQEKVITENLAKDMEAMDIKFAEDLENEANKLIDYYNNKITIRKAELRTEIQLEKIKAIDNIEYKKMRARGKREAQRIKHRTVLTDEKARIIEKYEAKLRKLEEL